MLETVGAQVNGLYVLRPMQEEAAYALVNRLREQLCASKVDESRQAEDSQPSKDSLALSVERVRAAMIAKGYGICGVPPTKDMVHAILSKACGGVGPLGANVRLSEMTSEESCRYFENIRDWAAKELQCVIPDPDKEWKTK